jgi:hypothetical protein
VKQTKTDNPGDPTSISSDPSEVQVLSKGPPPFESGRVVEERCNKAFATLMVWVKAQAGQVARFDAVEAGVVKQIFELGRLLLSLYLACAEERVFAMTPAIVIESQRAYAKNQRKVRQLGTYFGKVWFWRTYMYSAPRGRSNGGGFFPLDRALGLARDGFSWLVIKLAVRLTVDMPFERAALTMTQFLGWSPATRTLEELVLGLGARAHEFQVQAPPPANDGDVLVIQPDGKGAPTATDSELAKRRVKRPRPAPGVPREENSPRHRGRKKREGQGPKKRRAPGDKSKNARVATMVVMYTLRTSSGEDGKPKLIGPINKRYLASFRPKKYAFEVARREAIKRGFGPESGKRIQFVSDGDDDFEGYIKEYFGDYLPGTIVTTLDLPHVMEYVWSAAGVIFKNQEGSGQVAEWVANQKKRLLDGDPHAIICDLKAELEVIPKTGPGNKGRRERLSKAIGYLETNIHRLNYRQVRDEDLELGSGAVEGGIKHVIGYRFDHGGMRWIRERAEALLQLRCIALSGQWDDLFVWLKKEVDSEVGLGIRLRRRHAAPLPKIPSTMQGKAA